MKKLFILLFVISPLFLSAQEQQRPFRAHLLNKEYDIALKIDFYDESVTIPGQELYGNLPGYLYKRSNSFCWIITSVEIKGNKARLSLINDYGSEDLTASLTQIDDSLYILRQENGSTMKVPQNGKWQKLPKTLEFKPFRKN